MVSDKNNNLTMRPAKTQISLGILPQSGLLRTQCFVMRTLKTLIRPGAHSDCLFCHAVAHISKRYRSYTGDYCFYSPVASAHRGHRAFGFSISMCICASVHPLKFHMKMFVNIARLDIRQFFTQSARRENPYTLDTILVSLSFFLPKIYFMISKRASASKL